MSEPKILDLYGEEIEGNHVALGQTTEGAMFVIAASDRQEGLREVAEDIAGRIREPEHYANSAIIIVPLGVLRVDGNDDSHIVTFGR